MEIIVECLREGGEPTPQNIVFENRRLKVLQVVDRWLSQSHQYYKVLTEDSSLYILRQDTGNSQWELTFFREGENAFH